MSEPITPTGQHDHTRCVSSALSAAEARCINGVTLTKSRRRVLEIVWESHRPIGAYDILDRLAAEGQPAKPPTVYRALNFLLEQCLIHRLETLNAFIGCGASEADGHTAQFLICRDCNLAQELDDPALRQALNDAADQSGFHVDKRVVELSGICADCRKAA
ncbi:MAG: Fur family transcriptional regulator [Pseudomonadota bacterium]